jgi:ketol-acid reductoisomerase
MYYDDDADLSLLDGKTVAILGFGSQGHAHSQNLKDSGVDVVVGLRPDSGSVAKAKEAGLEVLSDRRRHLAGGHRDGAAPDEKHGEVYEAEIADGLAPGQPLMFGHGFSIHYETVEPPPEVDVALARPRARATRPPPVPGGLGRPRAHRVQQDASGKAKELALAYAKGIGCTRGGVIETSFRTRPRRTSSASRPCSAAGRQSSSRPASTRSSRRATRRRWPTSSACTSSS